MKIALITSSYLPNLGGVEEHVSNVARVLARRGHSVSVWTVTSGRPVVREVDGIVVRDLPCPLPARSVRALGSFAVRVPAAAAAWMRAYRADRPELLHLHCFGPNGTYARWLRRVVRRPFVLSAHGETLADADHVFETSALLRRSLAAGLHEADEVTGCSQLALDDLVDRFGLRPGRGRVVFNGIDAQEAATPAPDLPVGPYLLAVGRVVHTKGFDLLLAAFATADLPADVSLVIGGDGPELEALRREAQHLRVADRVTFPGRLSRGQVVSAMLGASALVTPSRIEPFGITVLEGWRAGVPVIATSRGGTVEFVEDGVDGLLVDPEDVDALSARLRWVVDEPEAAAGLAAAGQAKVLRFSWEATVDQYEQIYRELV